ncbi:MAG: AAA family ATPase [Vannielia sp.]|uniref:hypothetical protein n=1 Tax=Vannielia sp. TaxID=2813045 RepID=UPI003B8E4949
MFRNSLMTIRILNTAPNSETDNAAAFRSALLASEPRLDHPDITLDLICGLPLPGRQLDIVLLYHDRRAPQLQLQTPDGSPIHSFVMIVEVKRHSPDLIRFEGASVHVRYNRVWKNASDQCDAQTFALKAFQESAYKGTSRRRPTFVQRMIWLAKAPRIAFDGSPMQSSIPVQFAQLDWPALTASLVKNGARVQTLVDEAAHPSYHSIDTLRALLCHKVRPTRQDMRRVNALTQTRFDADKTAYIRNLGTGLLMLRGRGGTGKTFALLQIALHLAAQGKKTVLLTYNHGLIADITRALRILGSESDAPDPLPDVQTRYAFVQDVFKSTFGERAEQKVREIFDISAREERRLHALQNRAEPVQTGYDYVLIDEGQDWSDRQRDLIYHLFGPERVVVADGVDQFVDRDRCNWDTGKIPINRRHSLRASRRTKGATCQTVGEIARSLGITDWDLEPDPDSHGGRLTVLFEPDAKSAVEQGLRMIEDDERDDGRLKAVDNLVCLPATSMARGVNYAALFDRAIAARDRESWRGFDPKDRRTYPVRDSQLRAVRYNSCRGMEGWTTLCLGLDVFFEFQAANPRIDTSAIEQSIRDKEGFLFSLEMLEEQLAREAELFAINWLMIPLTRSIDHLIIHLTSRKSRLAKVLTEVSERVPGAIEWVGLDPQAPVAARA